jgi:hypothetical protein
LLAQHIPLQLAVVDPEFLTQTEPMVLFPVGILTLSVAAQKLNLLAVGAVVLIQVTPETQVIVVAAAAAQA